MNPTANPVRICVNNSFVETTTVYITPDPIHPIATVTYSLDSGAFVSPPTGNPLTNFPYSNLAAGTHTVDIKYTDTSVPPVECIKRVTFNSVVYTGPTSLTPTLTSLNTYTLATVGGTQPYTYTVNGVNQGSNNVIVTTYTGIYNIIVTDFYGCYLVINPKLDFIDVVIPPVFTPSGGTNTTWGPQFVDNLPNVRTEVFDRYGRSIITLLQNQTWDGKYNGLELPTGDYWYVIKLNGDQDNREFTGNFTLYR